MGSKVKRFLHQFFKIFIIFMIATLAINLILFGILYAYHRSKCNDEEVYMNEPGVMVEVDGKYIHVYEAGDKDAEKTIVFIHDGLSSDDSIAIQPLFDELSEYHLVYIDRSGYGFTESSGTDKDIDSILQETRGALEACDISGPYILMASGTGGLEALYWAHTYEEEVEAIIGIDMNYPEQFDGITTDEYTGFFDWLMYKLTSIGAMRLSGSVYPNDFNDIYSDLQMNTRNAIISQRGYTQDMYLENYYTIDNAALVEELGIPENTPMYMLLANPLLEPYINDDEDTRTTYESVKDDDDDEFDYVSAYCQSDEEYYDEYDNITYEEMSGPSRLYTYDPEGVAEKVKDYISNNLQ